MTCVAYAFLEVEQNSGGNKNKKKRRRFEKRVKSGKKSSGTAGLGFS